MNNINVAIFIFFAIIISGLPLSKMESMDMLVLQKSHIKYENIANIINHIKYQNKVTTQQNNKCQCYASCLLMAITATPMNNSFVQKQNIFNSVTKLLVDKEYTSQIYIPPILIV